MVGTPAYMSPEQIAGRDLDPRADIFSLGVMLYEMATGVRPFQGDSSAELASAILRDTPRVVTDVRSGLPEGLARIIRRCLEKDPQNRIQTSRDVGNEFKDLARSLSADRPGVSAIAMPPEAAPGLKDDRWRSVWPRSRRWPWPRSCRPGSGVLRPRPPWASGPSRCCPS